MIKTAIVGAGLIGRKRAESLISCGQSNWLAAVCDTNLDRAAALATAAGARALDDWRRILEIPGLEAVIAAAPNKFNAEIAVAALERGCHVLCEKPLGRNAREAERLNRVAVRRSRTLKTGFNHRHHPALRKARALVEAGGIGPLYYIRGVYGHGVDGPDMRTSGAPIPRSREAACCLIKASMSLTCHAGSWGRSGRFMGKSVRPIGPCRLKTMYR